MENRRGARNRARAAVTGALVLALLSSQMRVRAQDGAVYAAKFVGGGDDAAVDWGAIQAIPLPDGSSTLKIAHSSAGLRVLVQVQVPERAYFVLCQGLGLWIDPDGHQDRPYGLRYAGSKTLAAELEREHRPLPNPAPAQASPPVAGALPAPPASGGPPAPPGSTNAAASAAGAEGSGGAGVQRVLKRLMDPGILFVTKAGQDSMELECVQDGPCARSRREGQSYCYEFSIPFSELGGELPAASPAGSRISVGLQVPDLQPDREANEELSLHGGQAGGRGSMGGGMGRNPGAAGARQPGARNAPPGGDAFVGSGGLEGSGHHGPGGAGQAASYSVSKAIHWYEVVLAPTPRAEATSAPAHSP